MTSRQDFTNEEWITIQSFSAFIIKMALQFGSDPSATLKIAYGAMREGGLKARTQFVRDYLLWTPSKEEEQARDVALSGRDYESITNKSLDIMRSHLSEEELDEIRKVLFYIAENISRINLRNHPDFKRKLQIAQAMFDEILAYGIQDIEKIKRTVQAIRS